MILVMKNEKLQEENVLLAFSNTHNQIKLPICCNSAPYNQCHSASDYENQQQPFQPVNRTDAQP